MLKLTTFTQRGNEITTVFVWRDETWPNLLLRAKKENAAILFEDEASFAMWGSLAYTWGLKGQQSLVKTSGKRKNLKVFGAIDYFSGRFVFQTVEGKLNSVSPAFCAKKVSWTTKL